MDLLRQQRNMIARQMHIKPENFRWYAAFHDKEHHPHVHVMAWSDKPGEAWLSERGIEGIKSAMVKDIFKQDLVQIYQQQTQYRDALRQDSRALAAGIVRQINAGGYENQAMHELLLKLSQRLKNLSGKKLYGYLPADAKATIDRIFDELAKDPRLAQLYDLWHEQREAVLATYKSEMPERVPLSQNSEFKPIKNAIISEALKLLPEQTQAAQPTEGQQAEPHSYAGDVALGSFRLLGQLSRMIENKIDDGPKQVQVESNLMAEIREHKREQGLRI
jgi:hypothetical protein